MLGAAVGLAAWGRSFGISALICLEGGDPLLLAASAKKGDQHIAHRGRVVTGPVVVEGGQIQVLRHDVQLELVQLRQQVLGQDQGVHIGGRRRAGPPAGSPPE